MSNTNEIAKSFTADNKKLILWSDGLVTFGFGFRVDGIGVSRDAKVIAANLAAGWWLLGDACLYDSDEIPAVLKSARRLALRAPASDPGDYRAAALAALNPSPPTLRPMWTTIEADRDGNPRVQCWRLPRILGAGLSVWRERGGYSLWCLIPGSTDSYAPTGIRFTNLVDLTAHIMGR